MTDFAPVFAGWNVWAVYQLRDLHFEISMVGLDRDRRLRIWVEEALRLGAAGATVADPLALKGSQIEILPSLPKDLNVEARKEDVGGASSLMLSGPPDLRAVRFFNRGVASRLTWPHDENYLLDQVLKPSKASPATSGGAPSTVTGGITDPIADATKGALNVLPWAISGVLAIYGLRAFTGLMDFLKKRKG